MPPKYSSAITIHELASEADRNEDYKWVIGRLVEGEYLTLPASTRYDNVRKAFNEFKEEAYLGYFDQLGQTTIDALDQLRAPDPVSEQTSTVPTRLLVNIGQKTGNSQLLPRLGLVYSDELIVPGIPLTWGEMTKNLRRVPESVAVMNNLIELAKAFGEVREKYNAPIYVTSGYRPRAVNVQIGGARESYHIPGRAFDLRPYEINKDPKLARLFAVMKAVFRLTGIGFAPQKGFMHGDIRPANRVIFPYR